MANYVARWDPFADVVTLREAMDRLMDDGYSNRQQSREGNNRRFRLPIDAYVTSEDIVVLANMPGIKPEDVEIMLEGDTLTIRAERPAPLENVNYAIQERTYGAFQRTLNINVPVDAEKAEAKFENGLLTLTIPKAEAARPKQIHVMPKSEEMK
jgi:HSP20 family protein